MDFLELIPQPSGRLEHLSPDLLNLILQSTAPPPKDQPPEDEDGDAQWTPYTPHDATLVYNFLKGSRRLAKIYIDYHIRRLSTFQQLKQHSIPVSIIFERIERYTFAHLSPGFYWPITVKWKQQRLIEPSFFVIRNKDVGIKWIDKEPNSTRPPDDAVRRRYRPPSNQSTLKYELKQWSIGLLTPKIRVDCIV